MYTARPTVRGVYSTEHRIDVHCDLTEVSCCLEQCRRYPLTCDWKVTNTRHVHPWISKLVLKREKERVRMCVHWCVGGMWRRVTYGQLTDSSWHLYKKSVVFHWIDRLIGLHYIRSRGSVVDIVTGLWAGRSGVRIRAGQQTFLFSVASRLSYLMGTGVLFRC